MFEVFLIAYIVGCSGAIFGGYYMRFISAKDEQMRYGLRTSQSQKSMDTWEYANRTLGMCWLSAGIIGLVLGVSVILVMYSAKGDHVAKALVFVFLIFLAAVISGSVISVMQNISIKFDEDGRPIERE